MGKGVELNKSEIERLGLHEPIIKACFRNGEIGGHSYTEKLECMVLLLVLAKNNLEAALTKHMQERGL